MDIKNLKRKPIKETFYYEGEPVYVYNPTKEQQKDLTVLLLENVNLDTEEIEIDDKDINLKFFKELTSLKFPENDEEIKEIFDDPSDLLLDINFSLQDTLMNLASRIIKNIKIINKFYKSAGLNSEQIAEVLINKNNMEVINELEKETNKNKKNIPKKRKSTKEKVIPIEKKEIKDE